MRHPPRRRAQGFTLVELVITIVVITSGVLGILAVMSLTTARSADPLLRVQAQAIAEAYLEEILLRSYADPDADAGETRSTYDDIDDYDALALNGCEPHPPSAACPAVGSCPCDQFGEPIEALADYRVDVATPLTTLNGVTAYRVDVTVTHLRAPDLSVVLSAYRTDY